MNHHKFVREEHMKTFIEAKTVDEIMNILLSTEKSVTPMNTDKI
jgi:hypothetical protein